ncbi:hypothetical protein BT96DRAFT_1080038, partial [Gymnopus androsaceus JB14]
MPLSLSLLSLHLGHSDGLPLSVYLEKMGSDTTTDVGHAFSSLLFSYSRRWVSLFLAEELISSNSFPDDSFPILIHIHFWETDWSGWLGTPSIDIIAPRLHSWTTEG